MSEKIIQKGAEANIVLVSNKDSSFVIKDRVKKSYRLPVLDEQIRSRRTRAEAKLLEKASEVINTPKPILEPSIKNSSKLKIPFIEGKKLSATLNDFPLEKQKEICKQIGENIAKLHDKDIIHGDLTTSNMVLTKDGVYFIDFGLGFISLKLEDKAVDLHLLKEALEAKHFQHWQILFSEIKRRYSLSKNHKAVLNQLEKVEQRGRYKNNY